MALMAQTTLIYDFSANGGYSGTGDLRTYSDSVTGSWSMTYDAVHRLNTGNAAGGIYNNASITWNYDSFGNRLNQSVTGNPNVPTTWATYSTSNQVLTNQLVPYDKGISYDNAGNMQFDGKNNVAYDGEGRVCAVSVYNGATQSYLITQYLYNAEGQRIAKGHPIGNPANPVCPTSSADFQPDEQYILGQSGEQVTQLDGSDNWQHTNVYGAGQLLATYDQQGNQQLLHFNITDPLGTKRVQASASGSAELNCISLPFGEGPDCFGQGSVAEATKHRFTGKERDTESQLDYFGARYYGSSMGRWMSPDWSKTPEGVPYADLSNPQSLNLYGYVQNNPLSQVDADGHFASPWHFLLTFTAAIATGHDPIHAAIWGAKNVWRDHGTQTGDPADTHLHAMAALGESPAAA
jgi:RHS repeat-associated protein